MTNPILTRKYANPLEREYESWIVHQIENYFKTINRQVNIWAVSPKYESIWPADEVLITGGKLIGLQFKQAKLSSASNLNNIKWTLGNPKGQFELVQKTKEIYYVLPTFINRDWREASLHHCFFWRPKKTVNYNIWYNNIDPRTTTPYNQLSLDPTAYRWGEFTELLLNCDFGIKIDRNFNFSSYLSELFKFSKNDQFSNENYEKQEQLLGDVMYFINIII